VLRRARRGDGASNEEASVSFLVQRSDVGEFRQRYRWMHLFVFAAFAVLIGRLVQLQIIEGDVHRAQARRNIIREITLATTRGVIRDAYGKVLAANRPSYNVYVVPNTIDMKTTWPRVVKLLDLDRDDEQRLEKKIHDILAEPDDKKLQQTLLKVDVDRDAVAALETHAEELKGIEVSPVPVRYYPYGELAAHMLGYMREIDPDTLARLRSRGYRSGDRLGAVGIERRWESYLRGQRGRKEVLHGLRRKQNLEELEAKYLEQPRTVEPIPGRDISLTIDMELEKSIQRAMRTQLAGAVVVVDVRTGRVLAALSKPSFDPNVLSGGAGVDAVRDAFQRLFHDPLKPMLDKTISAAYPPGSTFKPFSAFAALSNHLIDPSATVDCHGGYWYGKRYFRCTEAHGVVNMRKAIVESCNTYFYELGEKVTIDPIAKEAMEFGFGVKTGIGVNPESRGRMPTRAWYTRRYKGAFRGGFSLLAAIGQGATTVTVMQQALAYAAIANGGTLYQPEVVRSIETSDGTVVQEFPPRVRRVIPLDPDQLALVKNALVGVVRDPKGTVHAEWLPGVDIAGKTGTAQVTHVKLKGVNKDRQWYFNRDHAWFAGYAPTESPEISIVVLIEHGGGGGEQAGPVAMKVVRDWQKLKEKRLEARASASQAAHRSTL
jgi:penicillin-binding protein 2